MHKESKLLIWLHLSAQSVNKDLIVSIDMHHRPVRVHTQKPGKCLQAKLESMPGTCIQYSWLYQYIYTSLLSLSNMRELCVRVFFSFRGVSSSCEVKAKLLRRMQIGSSTFYETANGYTLGIHWLHNKLSFVCACVIIRICSSSK